MRYLFITKDNNPFYTPWYDYENNYNSDYHVIIFDLYKKIHTFDGKTWIETIEDSL